MSQAQQRRSHSLCIISNPLNVTSRSSHNKIINIYSVQFNEVCRFANLVQFANKWPVCKLDGRYGELLKV